MKNILKNEKSSYLIQHKDNPVAWQPWSEGILEQAKKENKPLFISIGYSSCHWCHVMAHESFEDDKTAEILNKHFIPIKIDKEEFPDIDKYYQSFLQASRQQGGWPLSIFAYPDGSPFYGGTYIPDTARHGLPSFTHLINTLSDIYNKNPENLEKPLESFIKFQKYMKTLTFNRYDILKLKEDNILTEFLSNIDKENGGLKGKTKFPNIPVLLFLLEKYNDNTDVINFLINTADQLCLSGIFDHIRGGFFRYTIDEKWNIPHFEKMLYDNALNSIFLIKMYDETSNIQYFHTVRKTIDFLINEMNSEFGMSASIDADSFDDDNKLSEGYFYKILNTDIKTLNDSETTLLAKNAIFNENVLKFNKISYEEYSKLQNIFEKIEISQNSNKTNPFIDQKVISSWNMLACYAMLEFSEIANDDYYFQQAMELFHKIRTFLLADGKVFRINYEEQTTSHRTLEDASFFLFTLTKLFEMTKEKEFLKIARRIIEDIYESFYEDGILYLDTNKKVIDTFDEAIFSPVGLFIKSVIFFKDYIDIDVPDKLMDFAVDRALKFTIAHPTLLSAILI